MAPRIVRNRRSGLLLGACLSGLAWIASPLAGQELPLLRDYPGSGPYQCAPAATPPAPSADQRTQANQIASDANQAMILGDLERVQALLQRAVDIDRTSADLAYRHARVLEDLDQTQAAMEEFCRAVDLNVAGIGVLDAEERLAALSESLRREIPEAAHQAFRQGLSQTDARQYDDAVESFTAARDVAPDWPAPLYNRGVVYDRMGRIDGALEDFRDYLEADPTSSYAVRVSAYVGRQEGAATAAPRSPAGAFALGLIPGMGQYYTGEPVRGTVTLVAAGAAIAAGFMFKKVTTLCVETVPEGQSCPPNQIVDEITERPYMWYGIGIGAAITIISAIDASRRAKRMTDEAAAITRPFGGSNFSLTAPSVTTHGDQVDFNVISLRFR